MANKMSIEQSLESIVIRLDELTGNALGNSYLNVSTDNDVDLSGIESKLDNLNSNVSQLNESLVEITKELGYLSDMSQTFENFLGWYIQFNENKQ
jgi:hypothetical protein